MTSTKAEAAAAFDTVAEVALGRMAVDNFAEGSADIVSWLW